MGDILRHQVPPCRSPHCRSRKTHLVPKPRSSSAVGLVALLALGLCVAGIGDEDSRTYPPIRGSATLTGLALQADGKTPWAEANVELWWHGEVPEDRLPTAPDTGNSANWETTTDRRGAFALRDLPAGRCWLRVSSQRPGEPYPNKIERSLRVDIAPGEKAKAVEVVMEDLELRAQVFLYAGGPPVAEAKVTLFRVVHRRADRGGTSYGIVSRKANPVGRVAIPNLEPGEYGIEAKIPGPAEGYEETGWTSVVMPEEGLPEPVIVLLQPYALRGTVRLADGPPAAGALVALGRDVKSPAVLAQPPETGPHVLVTHADAEGNFVFAHVAWGDDTYYWLYARGANGEERTQRVTYDWREPPQTQELRLTRCAIEGTLARAADGEPVADVEIQQRQPGVPYKESWGRFGAVTDADGRFRLPGCDPGEYELTAEREHRPLATATITIEPDQPAQANLAITNTHVIGLVVRPDGEPVAGARVSVGGRHMTETDGQGSFELKDVLPGEQLLTVHGGGRYSRTVAVTVEAESPTRLRVVVPPFKAKLIVTVHKPSGEPAAGLQAYGYFQYDTGGAGTASAGAGARQLDAEGKCEFRVEGESRACFMLMIPGVGCGEPEEVTVTGLEPEIRHTVRLEPAGSISGVVREEGTGRPMGGVMITPRQAAPAGEGPPPWNWIYDPPIGPADRSVFPATGSRDGDGTFTIEPLPAATYELEVWDLFGQSHKVPVTLGPQQHLEGLEITVPRQEQAATVSGVILDPDGRPVKSHEVALRVWGTGSWEPSTPEFFQGIGKLRRVVTDEQGRFTLDPMPRQRWLIVPRERMYTWNCGVVVSLESGSMSGVKIKLPPEDEGR